MSWIDATKSQVDGRLSQLEEQVFLPADMAQQLEEQVKKLELSHCTMTIEMGGVVFSNKYTMEAWVCWFVEDKLYWFAVDMVSSFLLVDPKYKILDQGLK